MRRILFVGQTGSGKTTLCQRLHEQELRYRKTQAVEFFPEAIDTPGEYLENRRLYPALITSAAQAQVIGLVADPTAASLFLPPSFAGSFDKPVIGIVTKIGLASQGKIQQAQRALKEAGADPIFWVDTLENVGMEKLLTWLKKEGHDGDVAKRWD